MARLNRIPEPMPISRGPTDPPNAWRLLDYRWQEALPIPPWLDLTGSAATTATVAIDRVAKHEFAAGVAGVRPALTCKTGTQMWGYGANGQAASYPGPTIVAKLQTPVTITWENQLPEGVPYPFIEPPLDAISGNMAGRYRRGSACVHLHGAHVPWKSDGHPVRKPGFSAVLRPKVAAASSIVCTYPNFQPGGALLWYHDHTMDATARNVMAGLAGGYLLRHPGEAATTLPTNSPDAGVIREIPLIIQDRSFDNSGQLLYGDAAYLANRIAAQKDGRAKIRQTPAPTPEFKGAAMVVNGKVWPRLTVEAEPYRFHILNGCNSRMLVLRLSPGLPGTPLVAPDSSVLAPNLPIFQIGGDAGFLPQVVTLRGTLTGEPPVASSKDFLVLAPGERADVVIDFSGWNDTALYLSNHADETPGLGLGNGGDAASAANGTDAVLQFLINRPQIPAPRDDQAIAQALQQSLDTLGAPMGGIVMLPPPQPDPLPPASRRYVIREFSIAMTERNRSVMLSAPLNCMPWNAITFQPDITLFDEPGLLWGGTPPTPVGRRVPAGGRGASCVPGGGPAPDPAPAAPHYLNKPAELWEFYNISVDVHPIHLHLASFMVLSRQAINAAPLLTLGEKKEADDNEKGWKDTVRSNPNEVVRLLVRFDDQGDTAHDYSGHFVWHCHLLEHEDMGMMRPLDIEPPLP